MTTTPEIRPLNLGIEEADSDAVSEVAVKIAQRSAKVLRRAMPFLDRQRAILTASEAHAPDEDPSVAFAEGPSVVTCIGSPQSEWMSVQLDSDAIISLMDGLFTSPSEDGEDEEEEEDEDDEEEGGGLGEQLTLAQRALMRIVSRDIAAIVYQELQRESTLQLSGETYTHLGTEERYEPPGDALVIEIAIEEVPRPWAIRLFVGSRGLKQAQTAADQNESTSVSNQTLAQSIVPVPLSVVAELGRVTMRLSDVLRLQEGEVVRLTAASSDPIVVRVEGVPKFLASPVISRGQAAVSIEARYLE